LSPQLRKRLAQQGIAEADHDDLLQECFLALWLRNDVTHPEAFVGATLANRMNMYWRRSYRRAEVPLDEQVPQPKIDPEQPARCQRRDLARAVGQLPKGRREILRLRLDHGLRCGEIAVLTHRSPKTIANGWWLAVRELKRLLLGQRRRR
jgi:DNA-directed RNA polymerase specialized sigma24 family protein